MFLIWFRDLGVKKNGAFQLTTEADGNQNIVLLWKYFGEVFSQNDVKREITRMIIQKFWSFKCNIMWAYYSIVGDNYIALYGAIAIV